MALLLFTFLYEEWDHKLIYIKKKTVNLLTCSMLIVPDTPLLDSSLTLALLTPSNPAVKSRMLSGEDWSV